jgi:hypothetical protein
LSDVQLSVTGSKSDVTGLVRLTVTDPNTEVRSVGFYTTRAGRRIGPLTPQNPSSGVYEAVVLLDAAHGTRLEYEVVLENGSILQAPAALLGPRFEPLATTPGTFASFAATAATSRIDVSAALGNAVLWKCYARRGARPTVDGEANSPPHDEYLRTVSAESETVAMTASPGTWHVLGLGYNSAGQPGPRHQTTVQVTQ